MIHHSLNHDVVVSAALDGYLQKNHRCRDDAVLRAMR
jgi:hypothetical protein